MASRFSSSSNPKSFLSDKISYAIRGKTCPICIEAIRDRKAAVITVCMHAFCFDCVCEWSRIKRNCPLCNAAFDSLFVNMDNLAGRFYRKVLSGLDEVILKEARFEGVSNRRNRLAAERVIRRSRSEMNIVSSRSRPLPWRRSFGRPGTVHPNVVAERVLRWRASIYNQKLQAVASSSRNHTCQIMSVNKYVKERILERIEPWIRRELNAILGDPDSSVIVHVASSLFITSLEEKHKSPSIHIGEEDVSLAPLRPFLHELTNTFWHELRHFAESSLTMEAYDAVVEYKPLD